jgi:hypothetical protein
VPEEVLAVLRELERADERIGAALADLDGLAGEVDSMRAEAVELGALAARLPGERKARAAELERATAEAAAAEQILGEAEDAVRAAGPTDAQEAKRFHVRARDRVSVAERRLAEAAAAAIDLENRTGEATIRGQALHARARKLAGDLRGRSRIADDAGKEPGLEGVEAWSAVARASLFVARGQLSAEREAVIRQANELGALALGEPLSAMGAGALTRRVEQALM